LRIPNFKTIAIYELNCEKKIPYSEAKSFSAFRKFPTIFGTRRYIMAFIMARNLSYTKPGQSTP
jgi:hypothetical protein